MSNLKLMKTKFTILLVMFMSAHIAQAQVLSLAVYDVTNSVDTALTLSPEFSPGTLDYSITVPYEVDRINILAEIYPPGIVNVADTNNLLPGANIIKLYGYTITVIRETLITGLYGLAVYNYYGETPLSLSPPFDSGIFDYTVTVPYEVDKINITAAVRPPAFNISNTGTKKLSPGYNTVKLDLYNAVSSIPMRTYTVTVNRKTITPGTGLTSLKVSGMDGTQFSLSPPFNENIFNYAVTVQKSLTQIEIEAESPIGIPSGQGIYVLPENDATFQVSITSHSAYYEYNITVHKRLETGFNDIHSTGYNTVWVDGSSLHISSGVSECVSIYNLNGNLLYSGNKQSGKFTFNLNPVEGSKIIIIRGSSGWVRKVIL